MNITELKALHFDLGRVPVHRAVVALLGGIIANVEELNAHREKIDAERARLDAVLIGITGAADGSQAINEVCAFAERLTGELADMFNRAKTYAQDGCAGCEGCAEHEGAAQLGQQESDPPGQGLSMSQALDGITLDQLTQGPDGATGQAATDKPEA